MPISKRPRAAKGQATVNPFTIAGGLLYGFFNRTHSAFMDAIMERDARRTNRDRRQRSNGSWKPATAGSQEAARRRGQKLVQHPSVVARFANHPTQTEIASEIAKVEKKRGWFGRKAAA